MNNTKVNLNFPETLQLTDGSSVIVENCHKNLFDYGFNQLQTESGYEIEVQLEGKSLYHCVRYNGVRECSDFNNDPDLDLNLTQESINAIVALNT